MREIAGRAAGRKCWPTLMAFTRCLQGRGTRSAPDLDASWQDIDWSRHAREALIRDRRVRYVEMGSGPAVVLIHGQGGCWQWWLRVLPSMAATTRVIALDLAGFGDSDPIVGGRVFDEHVATVIGLFDHLELTKAVVVGHSMGGLVSLRTACLHPERVAGLVLVNAGGAPVSRTRTAFIINGFRVFHAGFSFWRTAEIFARTPALRSALLKAAVVESDSVSAALAMQIVPRMASLGFVATLGAAAAALGDVTAEDVRCATLVVWGMRDRILPAALGRTLAERIPNARFAPIEAVGHCPMIEEPDTLSNLITDFALDPTVDFQTN